MRLIESRADSAQLLTWINEKRSSHGAGSGGRNSLASRNRVVKILLAIQGLSEDLQMRVRNGPWRNYWTDCPPEVQWRLREVDDLLYEYPTRPRIEILGSDGKGGLHIDYASTTGRAIGEQNAVFAIRRLVNSRRLGRVRKCECGTWFFALRADQRACSSKCRHRLYEQTASAKAKRKEYMRNYYVLKSSGKVK